MEDQIRRGEVWLCDMSLVIGSESGGKNYPVLIIQNNIGNKFSPCTIACVISSKLKKVMPTHVPLDAVENGLQRESVIMCEHIRTVDRVRLLHKLTTLKPDVMEKVDAALKVSMGIDMSGSFTNHKQSMVV